MQDSPKPQSCTLEKDLENKVRVIAAQRNITLCDATKKTMEEYVGRETIKRECRVDLIRDQAICKQVS